MEKDKRRKISLSPLRKIITDKEGADIKLKDERFNLPYFSFPKQKTISNNTIYLRN